MPNAFRLQVDPQGIATIFFDLPGEKVNILRSSVMSELDQFLDEISKRTDIKIAIFRSAKKDSFIAGADVEEIRGITDPQEGTEKARKGQLIFHKIWELPFPVVAVVHGICLGGGTELILACHYRLASDSPKTQIGLPEVRLGIFPGFGGTQRLPRLVGLQAGLDLILSGSNANAKKALRIGLVDKIIPKELVEEFSMRFAEEIIRDGGKKYLQARKKSSMINFILEKNPGGRALVYRLARKNVLGLTGGKYPAPLAALEAVKEGMGMSLEKGLENEAKLVGKMISSDISKNLIRVFYLMESVKKNNGISDQTIPPAEVSKIGVLGAGVMGGGIAYVSSNVGLNVRMKDINYDAIGKGYKACYEIYDSQLKKRRLTKRERDQKMGFISGTVDYSGFKTVDLVIEAILEDIKVKQKVFQELEKVIPERAIIATNTSSLSVTEMQSVCRRPERVGGMHFFNPVHRMPLVEVVRGKQTSDETVVTLFALAKKLGKTPIVCNDGPGFLVNRLLSLYLFEAGFLLEEGNKIQAIDQAMKDFGMPMGPIRLIDEIGIDISYKAGKVLISAFSGWMEVPKMMQILYDSKRLGKKGGLGAYRYEGKKETVDETIYQVLNLPSQPVRSSSPEEMVGRMLFPMINEAARCLDEGIVRKPDDVDIGMIFGTGFPPFHGGLLKYADSYGIDKIADQLRDLEQKFGKRFTVSNRLNEMANRKQKFHS